MVGEVFRGVCKVIASFFLYLILYTTSSRHHRPSRGLLRGLQRTAREHTIIIVNDFIVWFSRSTTYLYIL